MNKQTSPVETVERKPELRQRNRCPKCGLFFMSEAQVVRHFNKRHGEITKQPHLLSKDGKTAYLIAL